MGLSESMKSKMMKVVISENGDLEFITPKGERIPNVIGSEIKWHYAHQGVIKLTIIVDAYMDNHNPTKETMDENHEPKKRRLIPSDPKWTDWNDGKIK